LYDLIWASEVKVFTLVVRRFNSGEFRTASISELTLTFFPLKVLAEIPAPKINAAAGTITSAADKTEVVPTPTP